MIPDQRIIDNIKKLKELGMSDKDIKDNLIKMNLSPEDSDELISIAFDREVEPKIPEKKTPPKKEEVAKIENLEETTVVPEQKKEEKSKELPDNLFDDSSEISLLKEEDLNFKETEEQLPDITKGLEVPEFNSDSSSTITSKEESHLADNQTTTDIWGSGLATTINSKLNEMEQRQVKLEEYIKKTISGEIEKYKKIQDTSKQLLISKISDEVAERTNLINIQLTKQLAQIKVELIKINKKSEEINSSKSEIDELLNNIKSSQDQLADNNKKIQENINQMLATTSVKLNTKVKEINDILALQSKITQGLTKNTQAAINDEIRKLSDFKEEINKKINPQQLYDKLNQLETFKQQLANRYETRFDNVKNEFLMKARDAFKEEIDNQLKEMKNVKDTIVAKTDPEIIHKKIGELSAFQTQMISAIDEKISQSIKIYESAITQELKSKIKAIDDEINKVENLIARLDVANEKIKELDQFKDQFIAIIDKNIEKMNSIFMLLDKKIKEMESSRKI